MPKGELHMPTIHRCTIGILAACASLAVGGCGNTEHQSTAGAAPRQNPIRAVHTGGAPIGLLAFDGQIWVADAKAARIVRIQPGTGRVTARLSVGKTPLRIAALGGRLWSTDFGSGTVSEVSPSTLRPVATIPVGPQPEGIASFGRELWVVSQRGGYLVRLVPGSRRPAGLVAVGDQPRQVAAAGAYLWVSVFGENSVAEVDPRRRRVVAKVHACQGPQGLAYAAGQLWVGCTDGGELVDIDPASRRVVRHVPYASADGVVRDGAFLRVTSDLGPSTGLLDPTTGVLSHNVKLADSFIGDANADVVAGGGGVWVSSPDQGVVYALPPGRAGGPVSRAAAITPIG